MVTKTTTEGPYFQEAIISNSFNKNPLNVGCMAFPQTSEITRVRGLSRSIRKSKFVRRKTYVPSFGRWKRALLTMNPWQYLGYAEMNYFFIGFLGAR